MAVAFLAADIIFIDYPMEAHAQTPPTFSSATLDRGTGVLAVTFSEIIDATPSTDIDPTKFHIREKNTSTGGVTLSAAELGTTSGSATVSFTLTTAKLAAVNALTTPELTIDPGAVQDTSGTAFAATFDVSTAVFTDSFSVSAQDDLPRGLAFSSDGDKMFVVGATGSDVNEYALSTPFSITTANFTDSFSVSGQDTFPAGLAFSSDGDKMLVAGLFGRDVNEYALSTPFSITTANFTDSFSVSDQDTSPVGLAFSSDGDKMFVVGATGSDVNEYALSTPFSITTANFTDSFSVSDQDTSPVGLAFSSDGDKMFVVGATGRDVNEYALSTPFSITTANFTDSFSVSDQDTSPVGLAFSSDGDKMFVVGATGRDVNEYALSSAFDITVTGQANQPPTFVSATLDRGTGVLAVTFSEIIDATPSTDIDPTKFHIREKNTSTGGVTLSAAELGTTSGSATVSFTLTTAKLAAVNALTTPELTIDPGAVQDTSGTAFAATFDVSTAVFTDSFSVSAQDDLPRGLAFSSDGDKMFVVGATGSDVNEYALSTPFSITTANFTDSFSVSGQDTFPAGLAFSSDGDKMLVAGLFGRDVNEYALSTPFSITTANFTDSFSVSDQDTSPVGLAFSSDGDKMFVVGATGSDVNEYALSTPFSITTANFTDSFSVSDQDTSPVGLAFSSDGDKMFVVGATGSDVNEYALSTPFSITTANFTDSFSVSDQDTSPVGLAFSSDGDKMFVAGTDGNDVNEYALSSAFDITVTGQANQAPDADAGPDQVVSEGEQVTLDGTGSSDPDNDTLSYSWARTGGLPVILNGPTTASPTFTAPDVETSGGSVTLTLTVDDSNGGTDTDTVTITVNNVVANQAPNADAGPDQAVNEGEQVTLDGTDSSDPDGDTLSYSWARTGGLSVTLNNANTASPTFTAPDVETSGGSVTLTLTVDDSNGGTDTDTVTITVDDVPPPTGNSPVARAGPDQTVRDRPLSDVTVTLDGSASFDPNPGDTLTYLWEQIRGGTVFLSNVNSAVATFTPEMASATPLTFRLTVTDNSAEENTGTDSVTVRIPTQTLTANITADVPVTNSQTVSFGFSFGRDIDRGTLVSAVTATSGTVGAITPSSNAASYDVTVNNLSEGRQTVSIPTRTVTTLEGDTFRAASASVTVDLTDPAVSSARVSGNDGIVVSFSERVTGSTGAADWSVSIVGDGDGGNSITVDDAPDPSGSSSITLGLSGDIPDGKPALTLEYTGSGIRDLAGNSLGTVDNITVSHPSSSKSRQSSVPVLDIHSAIASYLQSIPQEIRDTATSHDPDAPIPPMPADDSLDFPLEINGYGYLLGGIKNTLEPQTIHPGHNVTISFTVYDRVQIVHFTLYMNLHGENDQYSDSDTYVRYDAGTIQIVDPHGLIESATVTIRADGGDKQVITFEITFAGEMDLTNMVARLWNADLSLLTVQVLDAFEVVEAAVEPEPMPAEATALTEPAVEPEPDAEPEPAEITADPKPAAGGFGASEIQTLKAWGGYSPEYADDAEFLGAFGFQGTTVPDYFRNIAKWFIDGTLDRQTLVNALEYFVAIESWEYPGHAAPESLEDPGSATTATAVLDAPADEMTLQDPDDFDESELRILRAWGIHPPEPVDYADDPNAPIPSIIMDGALDFPISINGYGYLLTGTGNTLEPQTVRVGDETSISFAVYGDMPIEVFTMYLNLHGADDQYYDSDTYVRYDRGSVTVTDPHDLVESSAVTIDADGNVQVITFGITFADAMDLTHIVARTSDANRSILTMQVLDAFEAVI